MGCEPERAIGSLSSTPLFAPFHLSILDQFEKALSASCIGSVCAKLLSKMFLRASNEVQRIERFIRHWISKDTRAFAYGADWNNILADSYSRLGGGKGPADICPNSIEKCLS